MSIEQTIYNMITTNTGIHFLDSGGDDGRAWQRNQRRTLEDFKNDPVVTLDYVEDFKPGDDTSDAVPTVSVFHYLTTALELDDTCDSFNALQCDDWDGDVAYGISANQQQWLEDNDLIVKDTWNSYNGESNLSQVLQGANVYTPGHESEFEFPEYILLQVHNGADVRGGYTDAKLFKIAGEYFTSNPGVYGTIDGRDVDTTYNGYNLTDDGDLVPIHAGSDIQLYLGEY